MKDLMSQPASSFSWKRAALFAAAVFVVFLAECVAVFNSVTLAAPQRFGEGAGRMSLWVFGMSLVSSYGKQTRKRSTMLLGAAGVLLCFVFVASIFFWAR